MYGSATLAMLVSSTSMNAAIATTTAISQGLYFGRHAVADAVVAAIASSARAFAPPAPAARLPLCGVSAIG